jgi:D-alanine transaminase
MFQGIVRIYVDGRFMSPGEAAISPFDRGFIFGDGIYEVIPAYGARPFRWAQHLQRLNTNLKCIGIPVPMSDAQWDAVLRELLAGMPGVDQALYLQVTRGVAPRDHAFPLGATPTVFAYASELKPVPEATLREGVSACTLADFRWARCDIKTTSLVANVWLRQQALEQGASEAILVRNGVVTEGAATNVFAVMDGKVRTHPNGPAILPGITRDLLVELMHKHNVPCEERSFTEKEMLDADEIWLSSSTKELVPVTRINDRAVAGGKPGEIFRRVHELFQDYKADCRRGIAA